MSAVTTFFKSSGPSPHKVPPDIKFYNLSPVNIGKGESSGLDRQPGGLDAKVEKIRQNSRWTVEEARFVCAHSPEVCRQILNEQETAGLDGWCKINSKVPTKDGGTIQLSYRSANKFSNLGLVLLQAAGGSLGVGLDGLPLEVSHRCNQPACMTVWHVCAQNHDDNEGRKRCIVWVPCPCGSGKVMIVCQHLPLCVRFCPGFVDEEDFLVRGVCHDARMPLRAGLDPRRFPGGGLDLSGPSFKGARLLMGRAKEVFKGALKRKRASATS